MGILDIPNELLLLIGENLAIKDISHLISTCHLLCSLLTPRLRNLGLQDVGGLTALQWASEGGYVPLVELAISRGAEIGKASKGGSGGTALHMAASRNHHAVARILIEHGAAVSCKDYCDMTPLHFAASSGGSEVATVLLERGADMMCVDQGGETPAHIAARSGSVSCMGAFITAGFDLNTRGSWGGTVLHSAASGKVEMVDYLLRQREMKMAINAGDDWGSTPLHIAACSPDIVWLLLRHGADMEIKDSEGNTPIHCAAYGEIPGVESLRAFIEAGFDLTTRGNYDRTVLHYAAAYFAEETVMYLLEQPGAEVFINAKDSGGLTPLAWVATRRPSPQRERVMSVLAKYAADLELKDNCEMALTDRAKFSCCEHTSEMR